MAVEGEGCHRSFEVEPGWIGSVVSGWFGGMFWLYLQAEEEYAADVPQTSLFRRENV
jgi:hypothetical protein